MKKCPWDPRRENSSGSYILYIEHVTVQSDEETIPGLNIHMLRMETANTRILGLGLDICNNTDRVSIPPYPASKMGTYAAMRKTKKRAVCFLNAIIECGHRKGLAGQ